MKTKRYDKNHLKYYTWHQINSSELIEIHDWFQSQSKNNHSKYYQQLNYRHEYVLYSKFYLRTRDKQNSLT